MLPSTTFRQMYFNYFFQSWFQVYITFSTILVIFIFNFFPVTKNRCILVVLFCILLTIPVIQNLSDGARFMLGDLPFYGDIDEFNKPISFDDKSIFYISADIKTYSGLLLLLPISLMGLLFWVTRYKEPANIYFFIFSLFGGLLLLFQNRLNYFGSYVLYFPLCLIAIHFSLKSRKHKYVALFTTTLIVFMSYSISIKQLVNTKVKGGSFDYAATYIIYKELEKACNEKPGIVLADNNDGHYISY